MKELIDTENTIDKKNTSGGAITEADFSGLPLTINGSILVYDDANTETLNYKTITSAYDLYKTAAGMPEE